MYIYICTYVYMYIYIFLHAENFILQQHTQARCGTSSRSSSAGQPTHCFETIFLVQTGISFLPFHCLPQFFFRGLLRKLYSMLRNYLLPRLSFFPPPFFPSWTLPLYSPARSRKNETRNSHRNLKRNPEWSKFMFIFKSAV